MNLPVTPALQQTSHKVSPPQQAFQYLCKLSGRAGPATHAKLFLLFMRTLEIGAVLDGIIITDCRRKLSNATKVALKMDQNLQKPVAELHSSETPSPAIWMATLDLNQPRSDLIEAHLSRHIKSIACGNSKGP